MLVTQSSMSVVAEMLRLTWRTAHTIVGSALDEAERPSNRLDGLVRIGSDEISSPKGQRYLTVFVNLDTGEMV